MKTFMTTISLLGLLLSQGCGKAKPTPQFDQEAPAEVAAAAWPADGSNIKGRYKAEFISLNTHTIGFLTTTGHVIKKGEKLHVSLKLEGGAPRTWHKQDIYTGLRCPTEKDDLNQDGFIDAAEGEKVWGSPLIPLDTDLSSQAAGKDLYPVSNSKGSYVYRRSANFAELFKDLKSSTAEDFAQLPEDQGLGLEGNVLVIIGTDEKANLPPTVASLPNLDRHASLPVACGLIRRLGDDPGEFEEGDMGSFGNPEAPGPEAQPPVEPEVEPQTRPETNPETETRPSSRERERDDDDWDDRFRRWWRRTFGGGGRS